jgi:plasminogen
LQGFRGPSDRVSGPKNETKETFERVVSRIIGGEISDLGNWPWQAAMLHANYGDHIVCGGTIVTKKVVIGAAHCISQFSADEIKFTAGHTKGFHARTQKSSYQFSTVNRAIAHPDYNKYFHNDIALFELNFPFTWTDYVRPACLPSPEFVPSVNGRCVVSGFGKGSNDALNHAVIPIWEKQSCENILESQGGWSWTGLPIDHASQICAGYQPGGIDACQGDSGGPFVCKTNHGWVATGAVSYGYGCAQKNMPAIYSNIPMYHDWIHGHSSHTCSKKI